MSFKDFINESKAVTWIVTPLVKTSKEHINVEVKASSQKEAMKLGALEMGIKQDEVKAATKFEGDSHLMKEDNLEEKYAISQGYKAAEKNIASLLKSLSPTSNLCKGISKGADNVVPEFKKMHKCMEEIEYLWEEVAMIIDMHMNESHFKEGEKVKCKKSGMVGKIVKVDPSEEGKYYTAEMDGKEVKYSPEELEKL